MTDMLRVSGLTKSLGDFMLSDMELSVAEGCVTGFVGSNGAGKTTTVRLILGLLFPDAGSIELFGHRVDPRRLDPETKARIGVVFDSCPFPAEIRVADVGKLGARSMAAWDQGAFDGLCGRFSLASTKKVKELSRGMGMKLQLAFALAHGPQLLILDEATAGLDPLAREEVLELLRGFMAAGDRGVLISTHITSDLEKIADQIVCVDGGRLVFAKTVEEICDLSGVARCRSAEAEAVCGAGIFEQGTLRLLRRSYSTDILVPDRAALREAFPGIPCDRASIEDHMAFALEGEPR